MRRRAKRAGLTPELNVTPLVDVVLVLLIIFMVVTPTLEAGAAVELPGARHSQSADDKANAPVTISLTGDRVLYWEKERIDAAALRVKLGDLAEARRPVVIKADRTVDYSEVRTLFKMAQDAGLPSVSLRVIEPT